MATLPPYFGPVTVGEQNKIEMHILAWPTIGSGSYTAFSDYSAEFAGTISFPFFSGSFGLSLTLLDQDPAATAGPAAVVWNGTTDNNASYSAVNGVLTLNTTALPNEQRSFSLQPNGSGTEIDGLQVTIWIGT